MTKVKIRLVGTCPGTKDGQNGIDYLSVVTESIKWADEDGWEAVLVYTANNLPDPWIMATHIIQKTKTLVPLIAIQPIYAHPFTVAKSIESISYLYNRPIYINLVAGDYPRDRAALGDDLPHDRRYDRLVEYGKIIKGLLNSRKPQTYLGEFYKTDMLQLLPRASQPSHTQFTISGSSGAGRSAAAQLEAWPIEYPQQASRYQLDKIDTSLRSTKGIRIGVIVKESRQDAWEAARRRYPKDPQKAELRQFAIRNSDSTWVKNFASEHDLPEGEQPYWLSPYLNYQSSCPFLVGDVDEIMKEIQLYIRAGFSMFLIERPECRADSSLITETFRAAAKGIGCEV